MILIGRGLDLRSQKDCWKSRSCAVLKVRKRRRSPGARKMESARSAEDEGERKRTDRKPRERNPESRPRSGKQIEAAEGKKEAE